MLIVKNSNLYIGQLLPPTSSPNGRVPPSFLMEGTGQENLSVRTGWSTPPPSGLDGGNPSPPRRQSSIASTYYAAGSMPLGCMQEDFLVSFASGDIYV